MKAKLNPSQATWPGLTEHAAQQVLVLDNVWRRRPHGDPENQWKIHHGTETQVRRTNHVQAAEGRQDQDVRNQAVMWSVDWVHWCVR